MKCRHYGRYVDDSFVVCQHKKELREISKKASVKSYVLGIALGWGLIAMWAVFALDENIRGLIFLRRWNSFKWADKSFVKDR